MTEGTLWETKWIVMMVVSHWETKYEVRLWRQCGRILTSFYTNGTYRVFIHWKYQSLYFRITSYFDRYVMYTITGVFATQKITGYHSLVVPTCDVPSICRKKKKNYIHERDSLPYSTVNNFLLHYTDFSFSFFNAETNWLTIFSFYTFLIFHIKTQNIHTGDTDHIITAILSSWKQIRSVTSDKSRMGCNFSGTLSPTSIWSPSSQLVWSDTSSFKLKTTQCWSCHWNFS